MERMEVVGRGGGGGEGSNGDEWGERRKAEGLSVSAGRGGGVVLIGHGEGGECRKCKVSVRGGMDYGRGNGEDAQGGKIAKD